MSVTRYRAAPPRVNGFDSCEARRGASRQIYRFLVCRLRTAFDAAFSTARARLWHSSKNSSNASWSISAWGERGDFHGQSVAPSIFPLGDRRDLVPQLAVALAVKDARRRPNFPFPDPDRNRGV